MEGVAKESLKVSEPMVEARSVEFRVLGPLEARVGENMLPLGGMKQRTLLAALLLQANEVVMSDRLIDELWGAERPKTAATALQVHVSQLRKALKADRELLLTRAGGYLMALEPDQLDLHRFERLASEGKRALADGDAVSALANLRAALDLWHGPPLADVSYEPFAQVPIMRLEELRLATIETRVEAELALGHHEALISELESLVREHPFRECMRSQLMIAFYRAGRQAEALAAYRAGRRVLVDELGIEPDARLQHLQAAILRHDTALELVPAPDRSIIVISDTERDADLLLEVAAPLSVQPARGLVLARIVASEDEVGRASTLLLERRNRLLERGLSARAAAFASTAPGDDAVRLAASIDADLLLIAAPPAERAFGAMLARVLAEAPCDVGLLVTRPLRAGPIVVPFGAGEHDWAAVETGAWIARSQDRALKVVGAKQRRGKRDASRLLADVSLAVQYALGVAAEPILVGAGADELVQLGRERRTPRRRVHGSLAPRRAGRTSGDAGARVLGPGAVRSPRHSPGRPRAHCQRDALHLVAGAPFRAVADMRR
jgi:DNA-binding SARP family transcriptional activator